MTDSRGDFWKDRYYEMEAKYIALLKETQEKKK